MNSLKYGVRINDRFFDYGFEYSKNGVKQLKRIELESIEDLSYPRTYTGGGFTKENPYILTFKIMVEALENVLEGKPTSIKSEYKHKYITKDEKCFRPTYVIYFKNLDITYSYKIQENEIQNYDRGLTRKIGDALFLDLLEHYHLDSKKEMYTFEVVEQKVSKYYILAENETEVNMYKKLIMNNKEKYQYKVITDRKECVYQEVI
jgi:hypothetical protein